MGLTGSGPGNVAMLGGVAVGDGRSILVDARRTIKPPERRTGGVAWPGSAEGAGLRPAYCPASVATSCQFGSRLPSVRAKVQTSVTSTTFSGLPSTTWPCGPFVAVISFER